MDETLLELIEFIRIASAVMWEAAYRQVYIDAVGDGLFAVILVLTCVSLVHVTRWAWNVEDDGWEGLVVIAGFCAILCGIFAVALAYHAFGKCINPEWHAIQNLIELVK